MAVVQSRSNVVVNKHGGTVGSENERIGVVLVHGFISSPTVWNNFERLIASDSDLDFVSPLPFKYASPKLLFNPMRRVPDLDDVADSLRGYLAVEAGKYERLVLVSHSQGGLVVQRYLARTLSRGLGLELARIKGIILFACPNDGSEFLSSVRQHWSPLNPQLRGLEPLRNEVKDTQSRVISQIVHATVLAPSSCPIPIAAYAGESDKIVTRASAQSIFPDAGVLPGDHFTIVQPDSASHRSYTTLKHRLLSFHSAAPVSEPQLADAVHQIGNAVQEAFTQLDVTDTRGPRRSPPMPDMALQVEALLDGLGLGDHKKAERRVNRLFLPLSRDQHRAAVEAMIWVATTTDDHTTQLLACTLLEAVGRLDPMLIKIEDVEGLARSDGDSLRSSAAVLMWQWADSIPGQVPIPLLGRLTLPSTEDWYVHAPARAGAKQLLLRRAAARAIFDRMAASRDQDDRDYAVVDLLQVAAVEPRAVPADLARKLARDQDKSVATRAAELLRLVDGVGEADRGTYYSQFGL
ncbi:esterase/lipase family protein [Streptomyces sp. NPDC001617]